MCNILDNKHRYELSELSDIAFLAHDRSAGVGGETTSFYHSKVCVACNSGFSALPSETERSITLFSLWFSSNLRILIYLYKCT